MSPRTRTVPRKRPKQARSHETVEVLLTATARILTREGFDRASTNRIAREAGVSIGSLYQYFPSKEALVAALIEQHSQATLAILEEAMARVLPMPLEKAAREMVRTMLRVHAVDPHLHKVVMEQVPRVGRLERMHDIEQGSVRLTRFWLEAHRAELRHVDLDRAAFIVVQTVEALTHGAVLHHPELLTDERFVADVTELVVRYLRP